MGELPDVDAEVAGIFRSQESFVKRVRPAQPIEPEHSQKTVIADGIDKES
jgi:hypothetical protein